MRGLYVGRFQPFHKGHLGTIRHIAEECDSIAVVIANSEAKQTDSDPFSAEDRKQMIYRTLIDEDFKDRIDLYAQRDVGNDTLWTSDILEKIGSADVAYTANGWTSRCFAPYMEIRKQKMIERDRLKGTTIREMIREDNDRWKEYVPVQVADYIENNNLI